MKILILGYSNLFKRRILNVLLKNNIKFCIASKSSVQKEKKAFSWYRSYSFALNHSKADLVYISLPNAFHYYWAKKALNKNFHVIVDKPISENYSQAKNCGCSIITMPAAIIYKISKFGKSYEELTLDTVKKFLKDSKDSNFMI